MKKTLITLIILTLSLGAVGCNSEKEETTTNNSEVVTQEEAKEESTEEETRSDDEMYELYESKLEDIKKLFKENNIDFKEVKSNKNTKYDEYKTISYENSETETIGEFVIATYGISFDKDSSIRYVTCRMSLNVNDDEMKTKEFKLEETEFYKLKNILIPEVNNTDEINSKVNEAYKNLTASEGIDLKNENIEERILLGENNLVYTIIINP